MLSVISQLCVRELPPTVTRLGALLRQMAFLITVAANKLLLLCAILGAVTLLTTVVAGTSSTTALRAVTREMAN